MWYIYNGILLSHKKNEIMSFAATQRDLGTRAVKLPCTSSCSVVSNCCDAMDCSLSGSSAHGILQARVLEWVAISHSGGSSRPRAWTCVSRIGRRILCRWVTRDQRDCDTKWSKSDRERQLPYAVTYVWNLNTTQVNSSTKETHRHRTGLRLPRGKGGGGRIDWGFAGSRYKLLYTGRTNKVPWYSTGNSIHIL